jgi:hypothetical protein
MVEFDVHNLQKLKLGVHIAQASLGLVVWCLEIATFHNAKSIDGRPGWYFGLCFLTAPAIIFLTMTPRFPRTRKFANPYAFLTIDFLFALFWLSAFAAQASYNSSGKCQGACNVSKAVVGLGVFIWLLWCVTTAMSVYGLVYYRREGYLPGASRVPVNAHTIDPDKEAFSTAPHDDEYVAVHNADEHELSEHEGASSYAGPASTSMGSRYAGDHAPAYAPPSINDEYTGYTGYTGAAPINTSAGGRLQFPSARYDNV